jgi:hypothetical protein
MNRKNVNMGQCQEVFMCPSKQPETVEDKQIYNFYLERRENEKHYGRAKSMEEFRRLPPEEQQFFLVDEDSGVIIDTRDCSVEFLHHS